LVYSDHKNLSYATKPQLLTTRQIRWQQTFAGYWFDIIYRPGNKNSRADALSRMVDPEYQDKDYDKTSILKAEQLVNFDEECLVIVETPFIDDIKEAYKTDKLAVEITNDLAKDGDNNNKKWWMEINGLLLDEKTHIKSTFQLH